MTTLPTEVTSVPTTPVRTEVAHPRTGPRSLATASYGALALSTAVWLVAFRPWRWAMNDLAIYRIGSLARSRHLGLYQVTGGADHLHFTYPPFAAVFLAPLAALPWSVDRLAITSMTVAGYVFCVRTVINQLGTEGGRWPSWWLPFAIALATWLEPFRATISFGQVNVVLMTLIVVDLLVVRRDSQRGWLIGVAAAIKLTPLAFVPFLFATGRRRSAANAVCGFVVCALIGAMADPGGSREYWGHALFLEPRRVGPVEIASDQTVRAVLARALRTSQVPGWWVVVAAVVFAAGLAVSVRLHRDGYVGWAMTTMAITMLCVSPISWSHHWVWSASMLVVSADLVRRRPTWWTRATAGLVMTPFFAALIFWPPHANDLELHDTSLQQLMAASYVLAGILLVAALAVAARDGVDSRPTLVGS